MLFLSHNTGLTLMSNEPSQFRIDLAAVCGTTPKHNDKITAAIKQAKEALSIDRHTKSLTADDKAAIIQWHKERLSPSDNNQFDIETIAPAIPLHDNYSIDIDAIINKPYPSNMAKSAALFDAIENVFADSHAIDSTAPAHIEQVEYTTIPTSQTDLTPVVIAVNRIDDSLTELELLRIENAKLQARLAVVDAKHAPTYDEQETVRISFYALGKRQGVWLKGYLVNSLILAAGIDKKGVPAWLGNRSFDANDKNITEQVKMLIVTELKEQLIKARDVT
jgi:hypothetical protein